jgi:hypothetical protein
MRRQNAAAYCDLSPGDFDKAVAAGRLPPAISIVGVKLWNRAQLDEMLDGAAGVGGAADWRQQQPLYGGKSNA